MPEYKKELTIVQEKRGGKFIKEHVAFGSVLLVAVMVAALLVGCLPSSPQVKAQNLMEGIEPSPVSGQPVDEQLTKTMADFTVQLFQRARSESENSLVSPLSVLLALAMTANGAAEETLVQMEQVLGGTLSIDQLNEYLYSYVKGLPVEKKAKLVMANSIWFREDESRLVVEKEFLQKNADYYGAEIYKAPFNEATLADINNWVELKTEGMIERILEEIDDDAVVYLLNAIVFDAEWKKVYEKNSIYRHEFRDKDGKTIETDFMRAEETLYLDDGKAVGFVKPYYGDHYSFVALLPNEEIGLEEYIGGLTGEQLWQTIAEAQEIPVETSLPKFTCAYEIQLNDLLKDMGMTAAFAPGEANFTRLGQSSRGNIFIGEVLHKTFIEVDEAGTRAAAVTKVELKDESAPMEIKTVVLDRPFLYAIVDNGTGVPLFIGSLLTVADN